MNDERAYEAAEFRYAWFEKKGGNRADAVRLALHADDVIEALDDYEAHYGEIGGWIDELERVPEVEKRWFGLAEYRIYHRVKADLVERDKARAEYEQRVWDQSRASDRSLVGAQPEDVSEVGALRQRAPETREGQS